MENIIITFSFAVFYGFWRRCYGGLDSHLWEMVFGRFGSALHRNFWRVVGLASVFSLMLFHLSLHWVSSLVISLIVQFLFWDWTFGMYMGIGRHEIPPSESDIEEYKKQIFAPVLRFLIREKDLYGEFYDYLGMALRFTAPTLFIFFLFPVPKTILLTLGFIVSTTYLIGFRLQETGHTSFLARNFSELFSGFMTGLFLAI